MTRPAFCLAAFLAFAVSGRVIAQGQPIHYQEAIADEVVHGIVLTENRDSLILQLTGTLLPARPGGVEPPSSELWKSTTQVWVLRKDGRALTQQRLDDHRDFGGNSIAARLYWFEKISVSEIAGVAFSVNGKFHVRAVKEAPKSK
jgi:hypothetical protein